MPFTAAELEEMKRADAEIDAEPYEPTLEDLRRDAKIDRQARGEHTVMAGSRAEYKRAYYLSKKGEYQKRSRELYTRNRAAYQAYYKEHKKQKHAYYMLHKERIKENQRLWHAANREKINTKRKAQRAEIRKLHQERVNQELSQAALAKGIGATPEQVERWEHGRAIPSKDYFKKMSDFLEKGIDKGICKSI